jgi:hypothetical protein
LKSTLQRIVWGELAAISVRRLYVLHVLLGFDLNHSGLSEDHNLNINMQLEVNTF